jgi:hypothetical protein
LHYLLSINLSKSKPFLGVKFGKFGNRGEKIYGDSGFIQMTFRKGNFRVTITSVIKKTGKRDEQTSERFA